MRNTVLALGSFLAGILFSGLLGLGSPHTSTVLHPLAFGQNAPPPTTAESFAGSRFVPKVPPLSYIFNEGNVYNGGKTLLDGRTSVGETFMNPTFVYGGGEYDLVKARLEGKVNIELIGAAQNTTKFLGMFGLIGCPSAQPKTPPTDDRPNVKTVNLTTALTGNFASK